MPTYEPGPADAAQHSGPAYPSQLDRHALRASVNTIATQSDSSSHELHRDPSVAAGKRAQRPPSDSFGYAPAAAASTPYSPQEPHGYGGYQPQPSAQAYPQTPRRQASYAPTTPQQQQQQQQRPALNHVEFDSFRVEEFPEFDELSQQMAAANSMRANGGAAAH